MAYTTTSEIQGDFKDITFTTSSNVKVADVDQFILEADALINSYVGGRYVLPVAAGEGLVLLKLLSRSLVTSRIKKIMEVKQEKSTDANQSVTGVLLSTSIVMKILSDIRDNEISLAGAETLTSNRGFYSKNVACDVEPVVKKNEKQW